MHRADQWDAFRPAMRALADPPSTHAWIPHAGLCHGLFADAYDDDEFERCYALLRAMID